MKKKTKSVLTIAGSDPCGGAGIQADLKTFQALGVYGMAVITAITVQNSIGIKRFSLLDKELLAEQLEFLFSDISSDAVKTGMLGNEEIVESVAEQIQKFNVKNLVIDPIILASDSTPLLTEKGIEILKEKLLPLATVITPNVVEAQKLCGFDVRDLDSMMKSAETLHKYGVKYVIITGGHLPHTDQAVDVLFNGKGHTLLPGVRLLGKENVHGSGCVFSAALAAQLALGNDIVTSAKRAKEFVTLALEKAVKLGKGRLLSNPSG